ncbi:hypothetical protein [Xanthomonas phage BUDD]|nr:hypothetical protein [Xanthomonas phage BUDD]
MARRISLLPQQALDFAQLPMIIAGDDKLVEHALRVKKSDQPGAYEYVTVTIATRIAGQTEDIRVCVRKEVE